MKTLEINQMESLNAGSCVGSLIGLGLMMAGATLITGPVGAAIFAASFINGSINAADSCR